MLGVYWLLEIDTLIELMQKYILQKNNKTVKWLNSSSEFILVNPSY